MEIPIKNGWFYRVPLFLETPKYPDEIVARMDFSDFLDEIKRSIPAEEFRAAFAAMQELNVEFISAWACVVGLGCWFINDETTWISETMILYGFLVDTI